MDLKELDHQYSPSQWSKRHSPERVIIEHVAVVTKASQEAKSCIPVELGIPYGVNEGEKLDIFGGKHLSGDAPILVYVHGGCWQSLERSISSYCAKPLTASGIRTVVVGYDLAPKAQMHEIVQEIQNAAKYVLNMASKLGSKAVWFAGHSAGAHLSSTLLSTEWLESLNLDEKALFKGLILISGIFDLTPIVSTYMNDDLKMTREDAVKFSPMLWDGTNISREIHVLVAVGEHDSPEFQRQSRDFYNKLLPKGSHFEFILVPEVDHFDIVEKLNNENFELTVKICNLLKS